MDEKKHIRRLAILKRLGYFSLIFWPAFLLAGAMAFDAPDAGINIIPYFVLSFCLAYGILPFIAPKISLRALDRGNIKLAYIIAAVPFSILPILIIIDKLHYAIGLLTHKV